jgi:flagellar hook-associated protein FlgK
MILFQRAFEAAAKVVQTVEKMYDNLFSMVWGYRWELQNKW